MTGDDSAFQTRPSLLVRIRDASDGVAWSLFVEVYAPVIHRFCCRSGLQDGDAADVTQEVLAQVARSVPRFDYRPERGRFRDWLGTIARNKLIDHARSAGRLLRLGTEAPQDPDELGAAGADPVWTGEFNAQVYRMALERVRAHFEPSSWRAFELIWIEGRPAAEAAAALALTVDAVYVVKSRVLKRLREEILALADDIPLYVPLD